MKKTEMVLADEGQSFTFSVNGVSDSASSDNAISFDPSLINLEKEIPGFNIKDVNGVKHYDYVGVSDDEIEKIDEPKNTPSTVKISDNILDALREKSQQQRDSNKIKSDANKIQKETLKIQRDISKNLGSLTIAMTSIANTQKEMLDVQKLTSASTIIVNNKMGQKLDFENSGSIPIPESEQTMMDKFNGVTSEKLKDSNGNDIIPIQAKATHNAEKAIETKNMNETDFVDQHNKMLNSLDGSDTDIDENILVTSIEKIFDVDNIDLTKIPKNLQSEKYEQNTKISEES